MKLFLGSLILFIILIIVIYIYMLFIASKVLSNKKSKKEVNILSVKYLSNKFHIPKEKLLTDKRLFLFTIIDAFIMTFVSFFLIYLSWNIYLKLILGLILLIGLIYSVYEIIGKFLVKEGNLK